MSYTTLNRKKVVDTADRMNALCKERANAIAEGNSSLAVVYANVMSRRGMYLGYAARVLELAMQSVPNADELIREAQRQIDIDGNSRGSSY